MGKIEAERYLEINEYIQTPCNKNVTLIYELYLETGWIRS